MATTIFGSDGDITFIAGHHANFMRFAYGVNQGVVDETGYDSNGWGENKGTGIKRAGWSAMGYPQYNAASTNPGFGSISAAGGSITLQLVTGCTIAFTGVVSSCNIASDLEGQATLAYSGVQNGVPIVSWDQTP
jgi:hypothetical protein